MTDKTEADVLHGVKAIASFLGITSRQAKHHAEKGQLPVFRIGKSVCARRSTLNRWIEQQELASRSEANK